MPYAPGHTWPSSLTRDFAWSRVGNASTKCGLPSPCNLKMQKGKRIQTPNGGRPKEGQWSEYHTDVTSQVLLPPLVMGQERGQKYRVLAPLVGRGAANDPAD